MANRPVAVNLTDADKRRVEDLAAYLQVTTDLLLVDLIQLALDLREQERSFDERRGEHMSRVH